MRVFMVMSPESRIVCYSPQRKLIVGTCRLNYASTLNVGGMNFSYQKQQSKNSDAMPSDGKFKNKHRTIIKKH